MNDSALELFVAIARVQERLIDLSFRFERSQSILKSKAFHSLRYFRNGPSLNHNFSVIDSERSCVEWDTVLFHDGKWKFTFDCFITHSSWRQCKTVYDLPTLETDDLTAIIAALEECPKLIEDSLNSRAFADWFEGVPPPVRTVLPRADAVFARVRR